MCVFSAFVVCLSCASIPSQSNSAKSSLNPEDLEANLECIPQTFRCNSYVKTKQEFGIMLILSGCETKLQAMDKSASCLTSGQGTSHGLCREVS
jgi:hypothetical protein